MASQDGVTAAFLDAMRNVGKKLAVDLINNSGPFGRNPLFVANTRMVYITFGEHTYGVVIGSYMQKLVEGDVSG